MRDSAGRGRTTTDSARSARSISRVRSSVMTPRTSATAEDTGSPVRSARATGDDGGSVSSRTRA